MPRRSATRGASGSGAGHVQRGGAGEADAASSRAAALRRRRAARSASASTKEAAEGRCAKRGSGRRGASSARSIAAPSSPREPTTPASPKRRSAASLRADVTATPAERDGRAAAHRALRGRSARRSSARARPLAAIHSGMRSVKRSTRTRGSSAKQRRDPSCAVPSLCPHRQTTCVTRSSAQRLLDRTGDVADAPAAARDEHDAAVLRQAERPPRVGAAMGTRNSGRVKPCTQWISVAAPAMRRTSGIDSGWVTRWTSTPGLAQ